MRVLAGRFGVLCTVWAGVLVAVLLAGVCQARSPFAPEEDERDEFVEIEGADMDMQALTELGMQVLQLPDMDWRHAETEHFVLHFDKAIFARKVARMAEFFYDYIREDLDGVEDRVEGRSHIFIFRNERDWEAFLDAQPRVPEWTFSLVAGPVMCLQKEVTTTSSGGILAHEMTHLVMNRFFERVPPLWLNEGLAEYYGDFAYYAFKGVKRSKRTQFRRLKHRYPLRALLFSSRYPTDTWSVEAFYDTSRYFVAFLLLEHSPDHFRPFMDDLMLGVDPLTALEKHYGYASFDDAKKAFEHFSR